MSAGPPDRRAIWTWLALVQVLTVGIATTAATVPTFRHQVRLSFTHRPAAVTELYFTDARSLPAALEAGRPTSLAFSVVNESSRPRRYVVHTTTVCGGLMHEGVLDLGVAAGETATRSVVIVPTQSGDTCAVAVALSPQQAIRYAGRVK